MTTANPMPLPARKKTRFAAALAAAITAAFTMPEAAEAATPAGPPVVVGPSSTGSTSAVSMAGAGDGRFVLAWLTPDGSTVMSRRYAADGTPLGDAVTVVTNTDPDGGIQNPHVAVNDAGDYVVSWESGHGLFHIGLFPRPFSDPLINFGLAQGAIHVRGYRADGSARSDDLVVVGPNTRSDFASNLQSNIAIDADGDFSVTWIDGHSTPQISTYGRQIYAIEQNLLARRFHADGRPIGLPALLGSSAYVQVSSQLPGAGLVIGQPSIASDAAGDTIVAWSAFNYGIPRASTVFQRSLGRNGLIAGPLLPVAVLTPGTSVNTAVAMTASGRTTIAWDGCVAGVCARNYLPGGLIPAGPAYTVTEDVPPARFGGASYPSVALDAGGRPVFTAIRYDGNATGYVRSFDARGIADGPSQTIGAGIRNFVVPVTSDAAGNFVTAYTRFVSFPAQLLAQRYTRP